MRIKFAFSILLGLFVSMTAFSQDLFVPRNVQAAYKNQTRDRNGAPGENYWQNRATYHIKIKVAPPDRTVTGWEQIVYTNNSPDTLKRLNFKLYMNQHKPGAPRMFGFTPDDYMTTGTHIDGFKIDGKKQDWKGRKSDGTNKFIKLDKPLLPGEKVNMEITWHYKLSKKSGREGAITAHTFFIAYFFPRVAVYDDYVGWDRMTFTGSQEFYNDFNDYTLEVTAPKNYIVWATGKLQNPDAVLQPHYAKLLEESKTSDEVIHIATEKDLKKRKITMQKSNTWIFKADDITDMAVAVSNEYKWDAGSVVVGNGRRVSVQAAYDKKSTDFENMVGYAKHAIKWFSENLPGVPYPFPKMTAVRGFADMEYPMMINDSSHPDHPDFTRFVAEHEIAHTYFPFYMGINQTRFGFMDEGWATTFEYLIGINDLGKKAATDFYRRFRVRRWTNDPTFDGNVPIIIPTNMLSGPAMGNNEYGKASLGYLALKDMLGDAVFKKALQGYIKRWHGKHPNPWDFFYSVNDITGKNLNWFWKAWYFSFNYIDFSIQNAEMHGDKLEFDIRNIGGMPAPFTIEVTLDDGSVKHFHKSPLVWIDGNRNVKITFDHGDKIKRIAILGGIFMDVDRTDNTWEK